MTLTCRATVGHLWAFLDGELSPAVERDVQSHVEGCTECRTHFEHTNAFLAVVRETALEPDPTGADVILAGRVRDAVLLEADDARFE